jgi:hypothetical protein
VSTGVGCALYVDDAPVNDGRPGGNPLDPVALSGLSVQWGRDTTVDQPGASTCTFEILDPPGGGSFATMLSTGRRVAVTATGEMWDEPTGGTFPPTPVLAGIHTSNAYPEAVGGGVLVFFPRVASTRYWFILGPGPFTVFPNDPGRWDAIETTELGQRWAWSIRLTVPLGAHVTAAPTLLSGPWGSSSAPVMSEAVSVIGTGESVELGGSWVPGVAGRWVGVYVSVYPTGPSWVDLGGETEVSTRTNLVRNPSMRTTSLGWNYVASNVGTIGWVPDGIDAGAVRFACTVAFPGTAGGNQFAGSALATGAADLAPGEVYAFSVYVRPTTTMGLHAAPNFRSAAGAELASAVGPAVVCPGGVWTRLTATATSVAGTAYGGTRLRLAQGYSMSPGDLVDIDHAMIEPGESVTPYFDGDTPGASWLGTPHGSASQVITWERRWIDLDPSWAWRDASRLRVEAVDAQAPGGGETRTSLVFAGRITDVEASFDEGVEAPVVKVTATDFLADLDNRDIGDEPWDVEPMGTRFMRVLGLAGLPIVADIDPTLAPIELAWQDIDNQAATGLLQSFATSVDGVMWSAAHSTLGGYIHVEDASARRPLYRLGLVGGVVSVVLAHGVVVSSCDVLRSPITFVESVSDTATRVAVTWQETTIDEEGKHGTTEHTITEIDGPLETVLGTRRVGVSTLLAHEHDAQDYAVRMLARVMDTEWRAQGFAIDDEDITDAGLLLTLLDATSRIGMPLLITDLPKWSPIPDRVAAYVEGGSLHFEGGRWIVNMTISRGRGLGESVMWAALDHSWRWVDFDPLIEWVSLVGVARPVAEVTP